MNLVGVLTYPQQEKQIKLLKKYKQYIFAVEIRVDTFYPEVIKVSQILKRLKKIFPKVKTIITFRNKKEGGKIDIKEQIRKQVISFLLTENHKFIDYIDIEYKSKIRDEIVFLAKQFSKKLILSYHFLKPIQKSTFVKSLSSIKKMVKNKKQNIVVKIVINTDNFNYYFQLLKEVYKTKLNFTFFTVGRTSLLSRCFAFLLNMPLVYAGILKPVIKTQPDLCSTIQLAKNLGITK